MEINRNNRSDGGEIAAIFINRSPPLQYQRAQPPAQQLPKPLLGQPGRFSRQYLEELVFWTPEDMLEITIKEPDDFLKVAETLTRIGIESKTEKKLTQTCNILHKRGHYFITHFKELFILDGRPSNFTRSDLFRRNTIAKLLEDWELLTIVNPSKICDKMLSMKQIKILSYAEKKNYELVAKYSIGNRGFRQNSA